MAIIIGEIVLCLLAAALIGGLVGWYLHRFYLGEAKRDTEHWNQELRLKEKQLQEALARADQHANLVQQGEAARAAQTATTDALEEQLSLLQSRLVSSETSHARAVRDGDHLTKELQAAQGDLALKIENEQRLTTSVGELEARLHELESFPAKLEERESLLRQLETRLHDLMAQHDADVAGFQERIATLEPQVHQVQERDTRLTAMQEEIRSLTAQRDQGSADLQQRLSELESLGTSLHSAEAKIRELDAQLRLAATQGEEAGLLRRRISELEDQLAQGRDRETRVRLLEAVQKEKDGLIANLRSRLGGLEPLVEQVAEIPHLRSRITDLEPLQHQLAELTAKHTELTERHQWLVEEKDAEIVRLRSTMAERNARFNILEEEIEKERGEWKNVIASYQQRVMELEPLVATVDERDRQLEALQSQREHEMNERNSELEQLRNRVRDLELRVNSADEHEEQLKALQIQHEYDVHERDREIGQLQEHIRELESQTTLLHEQLSGLSTQHESELQARNRDAEELRTRIHELASLHTLLEERDSRIRQLTAFHETDRHAWEEQLGRMKDEHELAVTALQQKINEIEPLVSSGADRERHIQRLEQRYETHIRERDVEISRLRGMLADYEGRRATILEWETRYRELEARAASEAQTKDREIARLQALIEKRPQASPAITPVAPAVGPRDDLKLIHGIGPKLERMLNRLGIYSFREIALWSEEEIDRMDALLEQFHGRIRREEWVQSAREEHFKKYGERLSR